MCVFVFVCVACVRVVCIGGGVRTLPEECQHGSMCVYVYVFVFAPFSEAMPCPPPHPSQMD